MNLVKRSIWLYLSCMLVAADAIGQLVGGDVNKPVNMVYYIGNNNVGSSLPVFTVTAPTTCGGTGSVVVRWNAGTTTASIRRVDMHGGLRFSGAAVAGSGSPLNNANSFTASFTNLQPGTYTFSLSRDPYDDNLNTNNLAAGPADDVSIAGGISVGDQQRCAVFGVIISPTASNLANITATAQGASSCISSVGSVTISGLTPGTTYEVATTVGGSYVSTGAIGASGTFVINNLYPGIYPVRVRLPSTTCYRELNIQVPSPAGVPCFTTDELIDFAPTGTSLIADGNFGTSAATMPRLAGTAAITDYTLVAIGSGQPQDSRYSIARSTDNADNPPLGNFTGRLRNLQYPRQNHHIFACLQWSKDHTGSVTQADGTTNGFMMVVNANYRTDRALYFSGLNMIQGRTYQFSFWAKNLQPFMPRNKNNATADGEPTYQPIVPRLGVVVNGIIYDYAELGYVVEPASYGTNTYLNQMGWEQFKVRFTAPVSNANSNVGIYNFQQGGFGNDFLLDDVELYEVTQIGDKVWNDLDADGRQDANEPGMANVTVTLNDGAGLPIKTTVSDAAGNYRFTVPYNTANYSVTFIPPPNYSFTAAVGTGATDNTDSDPNVNTGTTAFFNLTAGANQLNIDCGLRFNAPSPFASIGDFVWMDTNNNGVQDAGEPGAADVVVSLFNASDVLVGSTVTDARGFYRFDRVTPGQYRIGVTAPPGTLLTTKDAGGSDAIDSDLFQTGVNSGRTDLFTVAANTAIRHIDAGIFLAPMTRRSIGDLVWNDVDADGMQDAGEPGLPSIEVSLYWAGADNVVGNGDDVYVATQFTDGFGNYQFNDLSDLVYYVQVTAPAGWQFVGKNLAAGNIYRDSDINPASGRSDAVDFSSGEINIYRIDAGLRLATPPPFWGSIGDVVWNDLDFDGVQDANEPLMPAITVTLYNNSGAVVSTMATDSTGRYRFVYVAPGTYKLGFTNLPDGYLFTLQDRGGNDGADSDADELTGETANFTLSSGATNLSFDAGIRQGKNPGRGSVGNYVWVDLDNDGIQDDIETGVSNITVTLREAGANGTMGDADDVTYSTVTNALGEFSFTNLPSSSRYRVEFSNVNTSLFALTGKDVGGNDDTDSDGNAFVGSTSITDVFGLAEGEQKLNVALGLRLTASSDKFIGDRVWLDLNSNGIQDEVNQRGIPGVTVDLLDVSGNLVMQGGRLMQTTTNRFGYYRFYGLANGTYFPRFSNLPAGFQLAPLDRGGNDNTDSDVNGVNGRVTAGLPVTDLLRTNLTADLGLVPVANYVGDYVWNDLDGDGLQEAGEPPLAGVTVTLYTSTGTPVGSTVTNAVGQYYFFNVAPGSYYMGFSTYPSVLEFTRQEAAPSATGSDVNPSTGFTNVFTVASGQSYETIDAGMRQSFIGRVGDYVWDDYNQDGVQDSNEPGLSGVSITLINLSTGQTIGQAVTRGNGYFQFFTVPVEVPLRAIFANIPGSFSFTLPNQGNGTNDSKVNAVGTTISDFMLPYGAGNYNIDAGIIRPIVLSATGFALSAARSGQPVNLRWQTATEQNTARFEVERSTDGRQFMTVASLPASGNSTLVKWYQYRDGMAPASKLFYRIRLINKDGSSSVSNMATVEGLTAKATIQVYPNPVNSNLFINVSSAGKYRVDWLNANGQVVRTGMLDTAENGNTLMMQRGALPAGMYRIVVQPAQGATEQQSFSVVLQ